jgi:hypothetical protein
VNVYPWLRGGFMARVNVCPWFGGGLNIWGAGMRALPVRLRIEGMGWVKACPSGLAAD